VARSRRTGQRSSGSPRAGGPGRRATLAAAATLALAAAGIAIAGQGTATTSLVSATFVANTVAASHSETCTGANSDSYTITDAVYTGTASSGDTRLSGPLAIRVRSVYDSTTNIGSLVGELEINSTASGQSGLFRASLSAVDVNGTAQGYLIGAAGTDARFLGSFSSTFTAGNGFASSSAPGTIGSGGGTNTALITSGGCLRPRSSSEPGSGTPNAGGGEGGFTGSGHGRQESGQGGHQD
jgi:hypothetical protein